MAPDTQQAQSQATISAFFSQVAHKTPKKRLNDPIDLTLDSDDDASPPLGLHPSKRARLTKDLGEKQQDPKGTNEAPKYTTPRKPANTNGRSLLQSPVAKFRYQLASPMIVPESQAVELEVEPTQKEKDSRMALRNAFRERLDDHFLRKAPMENPAESPSYELALQGDNVHETQSSKDPTQSEEEEVVLLDDPQVASLQNFAHKTKQTKTSKAAKSVATKAKGKGRAKKSEELGPSGQKYTPLEKQVLQLKKDYPDCLLLFEVGYKYRFFGEDAQIASKELSIACFPDRNFLTAMIPVHRRGVHVKKLLSQGHKVGIIGQTETAALKKAGDNRNAPFERQLTHLYTAATFIDELDSADDSDQTGRASAMPLLCLVESLAGGMGVDDRVVLGMVAVVPSTGEVTYDEWEDTHMRTELETRITHIRPSELLLPSKSLSKPTERMIEHYVGNKRFRAGIAARVDRFTSQMDYSEAFDFVTDFFQQRDSLGDSSKGSEATRTGQLMARVVDFPKKVTIALAHAIKHLTMFGVADTLLETTFFTTFANRSHMLLTGSTLTNLEIYCNNTDFSEIGSLIWVLDNTKTKFGSRLLKSWIGKPLVDKSILEERIEAVDEILSDPPPAFDKIASLLKGLPDLVKGLARVVYCKASPKDVAALLAAFQRIANTFGGPDDSLAAFNSTLWRDIASSLPRLREPVDSLSKVLDVSKARFGSEKYDLWLDEETHCPALEDCKFSIMAIESDLEDELKAIRKQLKRPSLKWTCVAGEEYLIEVRSSETKVIPASWMRVSGTKSVTRFRTPEVRKKMEEREQLKEQLNIEAENAWVSFLKGWAEHYAVFRDVTSKLAIADCLISLSIVANQPGYTKPQFVEEDCLEVIQGRHPMVEIVRSDPFVPNTIFLGGQDTRTKIITGPNMGGKSTCCRAIALIAVMAQIGSYVPADSVKLSLHDAILTRMGAADELARGRSTFMVEMQETSDILKVATSRSLLILDELGRGTSTYDGQAIASAVLQHLVEQVKPKVLFITHYPMLATDFHKQYRDVATQHAGFTERVKADGTHTLDFLYRFSPGIAKSYGIDCARLAGLPESILSAAALQSAQLSREVEKRVAQYRLRTLVRNVLSTSNTDVSSTVNNLRALQALYAK